MHAPAGNWKTEVQCWMEPGERHNSRTDPFTESCFLRSDSRSEPADYKIIAQGGGNGANYNELNIMNRSTMRLAICDPESFYPLRSLVSGPFRDII